MPVVSRSRARCLTAAVAVLAGLFPLLIVAPPSAAVSTTAIPFYVPPLGAAPQSGTLPNGVTWSIDKGSLLNDQVNGGWLIGTALSPYTWTFGQSVNLRFGIRNVQVAGETVQLPVGVVAESINPRHSYNAGTRILSQGPGATTQADESIFTLAGTTNLVLSAVGGGANNRAISFIQVTELGPDHPAVTTCTAAEITASQRFWIFGRRAVVNFGILGNTPTAQLTPTVVDQPEGTTVVTDTAGNLQFWSNAGTVYDKNSAPMLNGTGLLGSASATQTVAAFPSITQPGIYFIVTTNAVTAATGTLRYSVVDMSLNGGLGAVTATKNVLLGVAGTASEALTAIPDSTSTGFWVLTYTVNSPNVLAYKFDGAGPAAVGLTPAGSPVVSVMPTSHGNGFGTFNVSPDLSQVVMYAGNNANNTGQVHVFDFDALFGVASPVLSWIDPAIGTTRPYSADFSPNADYVYISHIFNGTRLVRYPIIGGVVGVKEDLGVSLGSGGQVRRGPDGRMYVANKDVASIGTVTNPDALVPTYANGGFPLAVGAVSRFGLPQTVTGCPTPTNLTPPPGDPVPCTGATGHRVEFRKSTAAVNSLALADALLGQSVSDASVSARAFDDGRPVVNYVDSGSNPTGPQTPTDVGTTALLFTTKGTFNNTAFDNNFAMRSSALINITDISGPYTFSVGADDGFRLSIGTNTLLVASDDVPSPFVTTTGPVTFPAIGCYPYTMEWFQSTSVAGLELRATGPGLNTDNCLVGDVGCGGLEVFQGPTRASVSHPEAVAASTNLFLGKDLVTGTSFFNVTFGTKPLTPLIGDWDGNGTDTIGTYEVGTFHLRNANSAGADDLTVVFGDTRGYGISGDFNGDGTDDVGVYRAGVWQIHYIDSGEPDPAPFTLGAPFGNGIWPATVPVVGDWDGDGTDGVGTYVNGTWYLKDLASAGAPDYGPIAFGGPGRYPVVGDWTGIGVDTLGNRTGVAWTVRTTNKSTPTIDFDFGPTGSVPLSWQGLFPPI